MGSKHPQRTNTLLAITGLVLLLTVGSPLLFQACSEPDSYVGIYVQGFEENSFRLCGSSQWWWVIPNDELTNAYENLGVAPYTKVYVEVKGRRSPKGKYGHLGGYDYQLTVKELVKIDTLIPPTCF